MLGALDTWNEIAASEGVPAAELAFRWAAHSSALDAGRGDAIIIGATSLAQLRATVAAIRRGPVSAAAQERIQGVWESVRGVAFLDNVNGLSEEFQQKLAEHIRT